MTTGLTGYMLHHPALNESDGGCHIEVSGLPGCIISDLDGLHIAIDAERGALKMAPRMLEECAEYYRRGILNEFMRGRRMEASVLVHDGEAGTVHLATDLFGLRTIYIYQDGVNVVWGPTLRHVLDHSFVKVSIDWTAVGDFLRLGHMLGDRTWFKEIKVVKPASIISMRAGQGVTETSRYWSWSEIRQAEPRGDVARDLGDLLHDSVARRFDPVSLSVGIALSGGLDSRMLMAAAHEIAPDYRGLSFTYGDLDSDEAIIAQKVAETAGWEHLSLPFEDQGWLAKRLDRSTRLGAPCSVRHMHGSDFHAQLADRIDINLNGFLGDVIAGGSYLDKFQNIGSRITLGDARAVCGESIEPEWVADPYFDCPHPDAFLIANRGGRLINEGVNSSRGHFLQSRPFLDRSLVEFLYSLPDETRRNSRLYCAALSLRYPKFFQRIPWQKTGRPIGYRESVAEAAIGKAMKLVRKSLGIKSKRGYFDFAAWVRKPLAAKHLTETIMDSRFVSVATSHGKLQEALSDHMSGKHDRSDFLLNAATAEHFLAACEDYLRV